MIQLKSSTLLLTLFALHLHTVHSDEPKVIQLNVLFRHGDRAPETFPKRFPNDPHMHDSFHPMGSGGLLNMGKKRMYRLGQILRNNYSEFLGTEYLEKDLYAVSSDTSRTKMSLQLVLAGMYPPSLSTNKWHDKLDWQPFVTYYKKMKNGMLFYGDKCEWFEEEYKKIYNSSEVRRKLKKYKTYLEELRLIVGKKSPLTLVDILILHNNLDVYKRMNLTMEPWMIEVLEDERLIKLRQLYHTLQNYNDKLRRLQTGELMRHINENLQRIQENTPKLTLFSAHDKNVQNLLQLLDVYDLHFAEFGSALIFELLNHNEQYYVKILYFLGIPEKTQTITLPGCDTLCPLDTFISLTKNLQITDEELKCKINSNSYLEEED